MSHVICIYLPPELCIDRSRSLPDGVKAIGSIPRRSYEITDDRPAPARGKLVSLPELGIALTVAWVRWDYRSVRGERRAVQVVELDPAPNGKLIKFTPSKFEGAGFELCSN